MDLAVCLTILLTLGSLLTIVMQQARISALKLSSQNNLKQIGLAFHNYESAYKKLPPGCDEKTNHGWMTLIDPYLEASCWYPTVDRDIAWDHPFNQHEFQISLPYYCVPSETHSFTEEGYGIAGYQGNPALLYRASGVRFADLTSDLASLWLAGEVQGNQLPFGHPFQWRELNQPIRSGPSSFGGWSDGAHFVRLDGSVTFLSKNTSRETLQQLANAIPLPEKSLYPTENRKFKLARSNPHKSVRFEGKETEPSKCGQPYSEVWMDSGGAPELIDFQNGQIEVEKVLHTYSRARMLRTTYPQDKSELALICTLSDLEQLALLRERDYPNAAPTKAIDIPVLLEGLQRLPRLHYLKLYANDDDLALLRRGLPHCEVVSSRASR